MNPLGWEKVTLGGSVRSCPVRQPATEALCTTQHSSAHSSTQKYNILTTLLAGLAAYNIANANGFSSHVRDKEH